MAGRIIMGTSTVIEPVKEGLQVERQECEWLLTSGILGRSNNLARVLRYICEEHFQGRDDHIKEHTIAVEALGRRSTFDPQTDTIVRVTIHALRKRLMEIYQAEGANRPVMLVIRPGNYAPSFVHQNTARAWHIDSMEGSAQPAAEGEAELPHPSSNANLIAPPTPDRHFHRRSLLWTIAVIASLALAVLAGWWRRDHKRNYVPSALVAAELPPPEPQESIHALMGSGRQPYVDHSGNTWAIGNYCEAGDNVSVPQQRIEGTEDTPLYLGGVRGITRCTFPVSRDLYEVHLYFAETSDLPSATRVATVSINAAPAVSVDVVDEAGGHNMAIAKVFTGIAPENDGAIHIDFISEVSLLNAVEILPAPSAKLLPVRIVANSESFTDDAKAVWLSDRYFSGGRHGQTPRGGTATSLGIYQSDRVGRFSYNIPAVPNARYRVKLYFREPWFGKDNGGNGGPGSRVFDVACNGVLLMKNFDILADGNSKPIVKTFENVQATAGGRIELYFMPVVNYPVVNAIEILPEN